MNKSKLGRPTDSPKKITFKIRLDDDTIASIDKLVEDTETNRSNVIRKSIPPLIDSKKFNNMLSMNSLYQLEEYSKKCDDYFDNMTDMIEENLIQDKFPAFLYHTPKDHILYIKYPTYKIRIIYDKYNLEFEKIKIIIEQSYSGDDYFIYLESNCIILPQRNSISLPEILCMRKSLKENEALVETLTDILKQNSISYEIWPGYYLMPKKVELKKIDGVDYIMPLEKQ